MGAEPVGPVGAPTVQPAPDEVKSVAARPVSASELVTEKYKVAEFVSEVLAEISSSGDDLSIT